MKTTNILLFSFLFLLLINSCGMEKSAAYAYHGGGRDFGGADVYDDKRDYTYPPNDPMKQVAKKVIYSTTINLTVKVPDTAAVQIGNIAKKYNGYIQQSGTYSCVIRVEEKFYKNAIEEISFLGRVESKNSYGEDVTSQYADYAIRLENAEKARLRYLELLAKAENVEAALLVEKELERLNETIELMKGQMNRIDHLATYSTITVYLKEKKKPGIIGYVGIGLYRAVKWLFVRN